MKDSHAHSGPDQHTRGPSCKAGTAIERDARTHGKVRWQQGYRIDELVHELDLFRQVLADAAGTFAESNDAFTRRHEGRARRLIDEAVGVVTFPSVREVVTERDRKIDEYTGSLERANHELTLKQRLVSDLYRHRTTKRDIPTEVDPDVSGASGRLGGDMRSS